MSIPVTCEGISLGDFCKGSNTLVIYSLEDRHRLDFLGDGAIVLVGEDKVSYRTFKRGLRVLPDDNPRREHGNDIY